MGASVATAPAPKGVHSKEWRISEDETRLSTLESALDMPSIHVDLRLDRVRPRSGVHLRKFGVGAVRRGGDFFENFRLVLSLWASESMFYPAAY